MTIAIGTHVILRTAKVKGEILSTRVVPGKGRVYTIQGSGGQIYEDIQPRDFYEVGIPEGD